MLVKRSSRRLLLRARSAIAVLAIAAAGCRHEVPLPSPDLVAKVGDHELKASAFDAYLERNLGESGGGMASEVLSRLFDQFVREEMLAKLARERGLIDKTVPSADAVEPLMGSTPFPEPAAAEISAYFAAHAAQHEQRRVR